VALQVAHRDPHADLGDALVAGRHEAHEVAFRIPHPPRRRDAFARDDQLPVAGGRIGGERFGVVVDLEDAAQDVVAVLVLAAADPEEMIEGDPDLDLPEGQHRLEIVGG
jgi:hypothetical protein